MDLILKGKVPEDARVLDIGCGEGRNGIYFIRNGYVYHGWDNDPSRLKLLEYLAQTLESHRATFKETDLRTVDTSQTFDFIICSRMLHFADSIEDFQLMWQKLNSILAPGGVVYISMDSAVDNTLAKPLGEGKFEFPVFRATRVSRTKFISFFYVRTENQEIQLRCFGCHLHRPSRAANGFSG